MPGHGPGITYINRALTNNLICPVVNATERDLSTKEIIMAMVSVGPLLPTSQDQAGGVPEFLSLTDWRVSYSFVSQTYFSPPGPTTGPASTVVATRDPLNTGNIVAVKFYLATGINVVQQFEITGLSIPSDTFGSNLSNVMALIMAGYDRVDGNNFANTIFSGSGNDTVFGLGGNDVIYGGAGNDALYGGDGDDILLPGLSTAMDGSVDTVDGGTGSDTVSFADVLLNPVTIDLALGKAFEPARGANLIAVNANLVSIENAIGSQAGDTIKGSAAANRLDGYLGNDSIFGYGGDDVLGGGDGSDFLLGGTGNDALYGGNGNDVLRGKRAATLWMAARALTRQTTGRRRRLSMSVSRLASDLAAMRPATSFRTLKTCSAPHLRIFSPAHQWQTRFGRARAMTGCTGWTEPMFCTAKRAMTPPLAVMAMTRLTATSAMTACSVTRAPTRFMAATAVTTSPAGTAMT
jgi:RTX calcium-binding nonapeptide repeat (4 copies)